MEFILDDLHVKYLALELAIKNNKTFPEKWQDTQIKGKVDMVF